jgi:hypothetical protein
LEHVRSYTGEDWEERVHTLLQRHYPLGEYQRIPDRDGGDAGLDGFSRDGVAYQFYAPTEPRPLNELYTLCRGKITTDIAKFIRNSDALQGILGQVKIRLWVLVVPRVETAKLLEHGNRKAQEVRKAKLPYVSNDFQVSVITDGYFSKEQQDLGLAGSKPLPFQLAPTSVRPRQEWEAEKGTPELLANLRRKAATIPGWQAAKRRGFEEEMIAHYLNGEALLDQIKKTYPMFHHQILSRKVAREQTLRADAILSDEPPRAFKVTLLRGPQKKLEC